MRATTIVIAILLASCTRPAPNTCCVTEEQCDAFGVDEIRPCEAGQACAPNFTCVAKECDSSPECTSPDKPICSLGLCVASCQVDDDCADVAGKPFCATDGACVGCEQNDQCPADAAFCDAEDRACRGCERDDECASGVCLEDSGSCADSATVIFVVTTGQDAGDCQSTAPCKTLEFAFQKVSSSRNVIHLSGGSFFPAGTITVTKAVTVDGSNSTIQKPLDTPLFDVMSNLVLEGITVDNQENAMQSDPAIKVAPIAGAATLRVFASRLVDSTITITNSTIAVRDTTFTSKVSGVTLVTCVGGTATVEASLFDHAELRGTNCAVSIDRSRFELLNATGLVTSGGVITLENNLVTQEQDLGDSFEVQAAAPGSTIRFNTFVNTSGIVSDGRALTCDGTAEITSNVFAYRSTRPVRGINGPCSAKFSIFDSATMPDIAAGEGNAIVDFATIFRDAAAQDFHPATTSAAIAAADPNLILERDLENAPRPQPVGSIADSGCFEAP